MFLTGNFSSTTRALLCASWRAVFWQKSWRRRRSRARTSARAARVLLRLAEIFAARESLRCSASTRRRSPALTNARSSSSLALVATATTTPRSTPTAVSGAGCTDGGVLPSSTTNDTNHRSPSFDMVAERMVSPSRLRDARNFTHPNLGSFTCVLRRLSFCSSIWASSGNRNDGAHRRADRQCTFHVPRRWHASSRSLSVCCRQCDGAAFSQVCSSLACTNS